MLFTSDLLNTLQRELCVDSRRIYATGKSNDGGFVGVLVCRVPGRIAAFVLIAGAFHPQGGESHPARPARSSISTERPTRRSLTPGNPAKGLPTLRHWFAAWSDRNGCFPNPIQYSPRTDVTSSAGQVAHSSTM
ncbi:MAG TPA: hypothetical protein VFG15_25905 [Amycolatopsis sp.]|nr:hypothetical protein [Amycolatopsis sp.]